MKLKGLIFAISLLAGGAAQAQNSPYGSNELVAAANKEGGLLMYTIVGAENTTAMVNAFNKSFPGIKVDILRLGGGPLQTRVETEAAAGQLRADVVTFSDGEAAKKIDKLFADYAPPNVADYGKPLYSDRYWPFGSSSQCIAYNSALVTTPPTSWFDLLDPAYQGRVGVTTGFAGGTGWARIFFERKTLGEDYWQKLVNAKSVVYDGSVPMADAMVRGEVSIGVMAADIALPQQRAGAPIGCAFGKEGIPAVQLASGIPATAPHPNAGRLFMNFVLSPAGQAIVVKDWAMVSSLKNEPLPEDLVNAPPVFYVSHDDTVKYKDQWLKDWAATFNIRN